MNAVRPEGEADLAISTTALVKRFGRHEAVGGIDLRVPRGSVFGFLGPNGSGKTTTIRMLLGLAAPTSGEIRVLGAAMPAAGNEVLPRVGALVEAPAFLPFLSGIENLRRLDSANRAAPGGTRAVRIASALERVGLAHAGATKVKAYSLGMKQRLGIAGALLLPRELLILDEPTNGLDPQGTREVRSLIRSLAHAGTTVFVSSHLLAEVDQVCTHAAVMSHGSLVASSSIEALRSGGESSLRVLTPDATAAVAALAALGLAGTADEQEGLVAAPLPQDGPPVEHVVAALVSAGVRVRGIERSGRSLEERFVALTGEGFDVDG
ncbi:ABC transporter ATP-binding protein [Rathayibacter sp. YIM 133350]|uniref:ABC transporter ATP-binding protein n=1 Tax=Rathayibacter sp. YIM 133350 TaxID=3131992 RepID=UPI00307D028C